MIESSKFQDFKFRNFEISRSQFSHFLKVRLCRLFTQIFDILVSDL